MRISMPFGNGQVTGELPDEARVFTAIPPGAARAVEDESKEVLRALKNPYGSKRLRELAKAGDRVAVIVDDYTRPTPTSKILPLVLYELKEAGVCADEITVVVGSGLHRATKPEEVRRIVGDHLYGSIRVVVHLADDQDLVDFGVTGRGTRVRVNREVALADVKVSIGMIEPHHGAGWSGGAKSILPGVSSRETVLHNHSFSRQGNGVNVGIATGNPVYEDMQDAAKKVGLGFICNVMLNEKQRIIRAFAGSLVDTHRAGIAQAMEMLRVEVPRAPDIAIVGPGGAPRDANFWQTEGKGLSRATPVVKDGGVVILVGECQDGIGHPDYEGMLATTKGIDDVLASFQTEEFTVHAFKRYCLARLLKKARLLFVTRGVRPENLPNLPITFEPSFQRAIDSAIASKGRSADVLVIPSGSAVLMHVQQP